MENLILIHKDAAVVSSFDVAERFHKRHDRVLRAIENLLMSMPKNGVVDFYKSSYVDAKGEKRKMYLMNRDGFSLLVMGFTGKDALKWKIQYIKAFNEMESYIKETIANRISQKKAMDVLAEANATQIDYIKANTIANKAVSNMYGEKKMIKKADMTEEMLKDREKVLTDVTDLMALKSRFNLDVSVKEKIYEKYHEKVGHRPPKEDLNTLDDEITTEDI